MPTRLAEITPAQRGLAVAAVLAVVLIIVALSSGGGGGGGASGVHDARLLTASVAYQAYSLQSGDSKVGGSPYGVPCHTSGNTMSCAISDGEHATGKARCPLDIGTTLICQVEDATGPANVTVTLTDGGQAYTATGPTGTTITDHVGGG